MAAKKFAGENYSVLKKALADVTADYFADFREKKKSLLLNPKKLIALLNDGSEKAATIADKKMAEVREKIGIAL